MLKDFTSEPPSNASKQERVKVFTDYSSPRSHGQVAREALNRAKMEQMDKASKERHRQLEKARSMPVLRSGHQDLLSAAAKESRDRRNQSRRVAPSALALRDEIQHQIPPITSLPVRRMNFEDRIRRRHIQDQSFLHSDSEQEEPKKPKDPKRRRERGKTAVEEMEQRNWSEAAILKRLGYGDEDKPSVHQDAVKYIIKDYEQ
ncbi:hypothetical protein JCM5353_005167 [Sporobolomyces roseus]